MGMTIAEKILAAHRAGLKTIILPNRNEKDLDDLPDEVRKSMKFILVDQVEQVFEAALSRPGRATRNGQRGIKRSSRQPKTAKE